MNMQKMARELYGRALNTEFLNELYNEFLASSNSGFEEVEKNYQEAIAVLAESPAEQMALLEEKASLYSANREYAAKYGFACGLYAGFRQALVPEDTSDSDFSDLVEAGLFTIPGMNRHCEYIENQTRNNEISEQLSGSLGADLEEHLISIDCAWGERVHYAAYMAFYCGYRFALYILHTVSPKQEMGMIQKRLMTEYMMGFIDTYK